MSIKGGGAVEAGLSIYLENFATTLGSREQLAIAEFADAPTGHPQNFGGECGQGCHRAGGQAQGIPLHCPDEV